MKIDSFSAILELVGGQITSLASGEIVYHDGQVPPTEEQIQAKIAELQAAEPMRLLRLERDRLITATDWWVLPDRTPTQAQLDYRQALRDITTQTPALDEDGNLTGVVWPEKPAT